jgi:hypothetical protein
VLAMFHTREDLPLGCAIAAELIRDDDARDVRQPFQQPAEESLGRSLVSPALHQDIKHVAVLIHRPPEIMVLTLNGEKHPIQMPLVPRPGAAATELIRILLSILPALIAHGFVGQHNAPFSHHLFDIAVIQTEPKVEPDAVADDLRWEPMALIRVSCAWWVHAASMPCRTGTGHSS